MHSNRNNNNNSSSSNNIVWVFWIIGIWMLVAIMLRQQAYQQDKQRDAAGSPSASTATTMDPISSTWEALKNSVYYSQPSELQETTTALGRYPRLCRAWQPKACEHLVATSRSVARWKAQRTEKRTTRCLPHASAQPADAVRLLLRGKHFRAWWNHVIPAIVASAEEDCPVPCVIHDTSLETADVVVDTLVPGPALPHPDQQLLALLALENGGGGTHQLRHLDRTDLLLTWLRDSDVPINYMYAWHNLCEQVDDIEQCAAPVPSKADLKGKQLAAAFVSNCAARDRTIFMQQLFRYLKSAGRPVDSWGRCMHSDGLPASELEGIDITKQLRSKARPSPGAGRDAQRGMRKIALLETRYKFALAFENSIRHDYVTEKALHPILGSAIPVVWGAPQACDFLPGGNASCINALDFDSPRALGKYMLELDADDDKYLRYFDWRQDRGGPGPTRLFRDLQAQSFTRLGADSWPCRLCMHVTAQRRSCAQ